LNKKILLVLALVLLFTGFSFAINTTGLDKRYVGTYCCPGPVRTSCDDPCANNSPPVARIMPVQSKCGGGCDNLAFTWGYERWQCKMNPMKGIIESYEIEERVYADPAKAVCCGIVSHIREINHSCGNRGCNAATGKCNPLQPTLEFAWKCDPSSDYHKVKVEKRSGDIYQRVFCKYGCSNDKCNNAPVQPAPQPVQPAPQPCVSCTIDIRVEENNRVCKWALFRGNYSTEVDADGKRIYGTEINCGRLGCNKATGLCNTKTTETVSSTTQSNTYCKPGVSDKTFIKFTYSNGSTREFAHTQCGSCQHCSNGECVPSQGSTVSGSGCNVTVNVYSNPRQVYKTTGTSTSGSNYSVSYSYNGPPGTVQVNPARNKGTGSVLSAGITLTRRVYSVPDSTHSGGSSASTVYFATTSRAGLRSDYKPIYQPSSTWTCNGSSKVPVDSRGNKIWSKAVYCALGCYNGSCNDAQGMCTYNSDCPRGQICKSFSSGKACVPSGY